MNSIWTSENQWNIKNFNKLYPPQFHSDICVDILLFNSLKLFTHLHSSNHPWAQAVAIPQATPAAEIAHK